MFGRIAYKYFSINWLTVIYLIGCVFLPAVTIYFFWSALYVLLIYVGTQSWEKTVLYSFWPLSIFFVGQLYVFQIIGPMELSHPLYPDGRSIYYKFTPFIAFGITVALSWVFRFWKIKIDKYWIFLLSLLLILANTYTNIVNGGVFYDWIILTKILSQLSLVIWMWWAYYYLDTSNQPEIEEFWDYWRVFLKTTLLMGSIIVILQFIKKSTLGLVIEQTQIIPFFGSGSDEVSWWIRPVGWYGHANGMAMQLLSLLLAWFLLECNRGKKIYSLWLMLPVLAILLLQSRTTLLGFGILLWWWWRYEGKIMYLKYKWKEWKYWQKLLVILLVLVSSIVIANRGWSTLIATGKSSGWETRGYMTKMAVSMSRENFWWGVGNENYMSRAVIFDLKTFKLFPEPVHNGFLLILVEQGVVGLLISISIIVSLYGSRLIINKNYPMIQKLVIISFLVQIVNMLFQPTIEIFSICSIIVLLLFDDKKVDAGFQNR